MAYCNAADVDKVFHEPSITRSMDDDASGTEDTGIIDAMLDEASGELWGYVKTHYATLDPADVTDVTNTAQVPAVLRRKTARLAAAYVLMRQIGTTPPIKQMQDDVLAWAQKVADGDILLDPAATRLADSTSRGVQKVFAPQGEIQHYGEADPGSPGDAAKNDFFDSDSEAN
jgi:phage gp36-like protein